MTAKLKLLIYSQQVAAIHNPTLERIMEIANLASTQNYLI